VRTRLRRSDHCRDSQSPGRDGAGMGAGRPVSLAQRELKRDRKEALKKFIRFEESRTVRPARLTAAVAATVAAAGGIAAGQALAAPAHDGPQGVASAQAGRA
jgi:hypothetical protein